MNLDQKIVNRLYDHDCSLQFVKDIALTLLDRYIFEEVYISATQNINFTGTLRDYGNYQRYRTSLNL